MPSTFCVFISFLPHTTLQDTLPTGHISLHTALDTSILDNYKLLKGMRNYDTLCVTLLLTLHSIFISILINHQLYFQLSPCTFTFLTPALATCHYACISLAITFAPHIYLIKCVLALIRINSYVRINYTT